MNRIAFCVTILLLVSSAAFAQKTTSPTTISNMAGAVSAVDLTTSRLTAVDSSTNSWLFSVASTTAITLDGNATKLGYIKAGQKVAVEYTSSSTSKERVATKIAATSVKSTDTTTAKKKTSY